MNKDNIMKIMTSDLWTNIVTSAGYRGYKILDTCNKKERNGGQFFVLLVFFNHITPDDILNKFLQEGRKIGSVGEGLDSTEIHSFYGTMRMLQFS